MKARTALVLHYNPVKLYPPAESGIRFLQQSGLDVNVITTQVYGGHTVFKLLLFFRILSFNFRALWCIARKSVDLLVVYEHLSIPPVRFVTFCTQDVRSGCTFTNIQVQRRSREEGLRSVLLGSSCEGFKRCESLYTYQCMEIESVPEGF